LSFSPHLLKIFAYGKNGTSAAHCVQQISVDRSFSVTVPLGMTGIGLIALLRKILRLLLLFGMDFTIILEENG